MVLVEQPEQVGVERAGEQNTAALERLFARSEASRRRQPRPLIGDAGEQRLRAGYMLVGRRSQEAGGVDRDDQLAAER